MTSGSRAGAIRARCGGRLRADSEWQHLNCGDPVSLAAALRRRRRTGPRAVAPRLIRRHPRPSWRLFCASVGSATAAIPASSANIDQITVCPTDGTRERTERRRRSMNSSSLRQMWVTLPTTVNSAVCSSSSAWFVRKRSSSVMTTAGPSVRFTTKSTTPLVDMSS